MIRFSKPRLAAACFAFAAWIPLQANAGLLDDVAAFAKRYGAQVEEYLAAFRSALKKDPLLGG